ncbi:hypothetical protein BHE74_00051379 [Ensete ventricosum]|nr:hypothetical protein BHE74_00051379 [Ensete ventricosum]
MELLHCRSISDIYRDTRVSWPKKLRGHHNMTRLDRGYRFRELYKMVTGAPNIRCGRRITYRFGLATHGVCFGDPTLVRSDPASVCSAAGFGPLRFLPSPRCRRYRHLLPLPSWRQSSLQAFDWRGVRQGDRARRRLGCG